MDSDGNHQRDDVSTIAKTLTSSLSLHAPPLPTLPLDLISKILCRLPVKQLLQLKSVCKSWNYLISDPKFAMKHLRLSNTHLVHPSTNSNVLQSYLLHEVKVHTLGTNSWKTIQKFPFGFAPLQFLGKSVSGTINWLVAREYDNNFQDCIVSLDLGNESCKEILLPKEVDVSTLPLRLYLGVLRDCLCVVFGHDVWIMKEHGNNDSWAKLYSVSFLRDFPSSFATIEVLHIFEDGRLLLDCIYEKERTQKLVFHNSRNGTFKFSESKFMCDVCVESLISPCS